MDYPALYRIADDISIRAQSRYLRLIKGYLVLLIIGSILSVYSDHWGFLRLVASVVFFVALVLAVLMVSGSGPKRWYYARALAESIKTLTWKYAMAVDPYRGEQVHEEFVRHIRQLLNQNEEIAHMLSGEASTGEIITDTMERIRGTKHGMRLEFYLRHRIKDQMVWYESKANQNELFATRWFKFMLGLLVVAFVFLLLDFRYPTGSGFPIEILASGAASVLTWIQVKRFQDLAAAYSLATHEISSIKALARWVDSEDKLNSFVTDAENAFSREHTQWVARRGQ